MIPGCTLARESSFLTWCLLIFFLCGIIEGKDEKVEINKSSILVFTADGDIHHLNKDSGDLLWSFDNPTPRSNNVIQIKKDDSKASSNAENSMFYLPGAIDGSVYLFISGREIEKLAFTLPNLVDLSPFHGLGEQLFLGKKLSFFYAIDAETGHLVSTYSTDPSDAPLLPVGQRLLWVGRTDYYLSLMDSVHGLNFGNISYSQYRLTNPSNSVPPSDIDHTGECQYTADSFQNVENLGRSSHRLHCVRSGKYEWAVSFKSPVLYTEEYHANKWQRREVSGDSETPSIVQIQDNKPYLYVIERVHSNSASKSGSSLAIFPFYASDVDTYVGRRDLSIINNSSFPEGHFDQTCSDALSLLTGFCRARQFVPSIEAPMTPLEERFNRESKKLIFAAFSVLISFFFPIGFYFLSKRRKSDTGHTKITEYVEDNMVTVGHIKVNTNDVLGTGSHGTLVYSGTFNGRPVAVKRMLLQFYEVAEREIELLLQSDTHPNVIKYYCKEETDKFIYMALHLCTCSLYDFYESKKESLVDIQKAFKLSERGILWQLMSAIEHLHNLNIVHRDIKPQNVLISTTYDRIVLSDLGLCKKLTDTQHSWHTDVSAGSQGWSAPETLAELCKNELDPQKMVPPVDTQEGNEVVEKDSLENSNSTVVRLTKAVDIFSAGCVFYYVLSHGQHPFGDRLSREWRIAHFQPDLGLLLTNGLPEAHDLTRRMLSPAATRPKVRSVRSHPYFWADARRLRFLEDVSDRLHEVCYMDVVHALEGCASIVFGRSWFDKIDPVLLSDLSRFRDYHPASFRDLLRAIRNKRHHYHQLSYSLQRVLGPPAADFLRYFTDRFPLLLISVYRIVELSDMKSDPSFRDYFEKAEL